MDFSAAITLQADQAHLAVTGDVDVVNTLQVRWRLDDALAQGCTRFTVDVAGLTFIDAAGLDAFVRLHNATTQLGGTVTFVGHQSSISARVRVHGVDGGLPPVRAVGPVVYDVA